MTDPTLEAETVLKCGRCGDNTELGVLEPTDTWHDVYCRTCGMEYGVVLRLEDEA